MFVLPPVSAPIRYPPGQNGQWGSVPGQLTPIETQNTINHPTGPEHQFSVGEGTYTLKEDIHLATPPPHPSEAAPTNPNPLSTTPQPVTAGTKLSLLQIEGSNKAGDLYRNTSTASPVKDSIERGDSRTSTESDHDETSSNGLGSGTSDSRDGGDAVEKFGGGNASLSVPGGKAVKRKPKNNIAKSNSSFVSRIITHEHLHRRLNERNPEDLFIFANISRAFNWLDLDASNKQEPLSKILFTRAHPTCHDVNKVTAHSTHIDVIMGFSTGDIIWFDPVTNKYARLNKNGCINASPVSDIRWLPDSSNLFLTVHHDGSMIVYDKEKEDAPFVPEDTSMPANGTSPMGFFGVRKSVASRNQKTNPVSYWSVAKAPITAFEFAPDKKHVAVVSEDQCLRVINIVKESLLDVYCSYYGGFTCVCWSPDSRYILTGGQDDLVCIWSLSERRLVARCEGHHSWVSSVAFDPWRCDDRTYRFGSVGHDCRLLLWDFSVGMLHKPKAMVLRRGSMSSSQPTGGAYAGVAAGRQSLRIRSDSNLPAPSVAGGEGESVVHPVEERARTAVLPPVMSKVIDPDPLSQLIFREDCCITTCVDGHIRTWNRPHVVMEQRNGSEVTLSASASAASASASGS